jgi:hypothetical protein
MNVKELREVLEEFDDDTIVRFSYDYGDRSHHYVAREVEYVDMQLVKHSDYIGDMVIDDNEDGEFIDDNDCYAVVLS